MFYLYSAACFFGTADFRYNYLGGIPLPRAHRLLHLVFDYHGTAVVYEHMASVVHFQLGTRFPANVYVRSVGGVTGLVFQLDTAKILSSIPEGLCSTKSIVRLDGGGCRSTCSSIFSDLSQA